MTRVRRRLTFSVVIGMAIALVGGAPLARDPHHTRVRTTDKSRVSASIRDNALAPVVGPATPAGATGDLAPATESVAKKREAVIKTAPTHFEGEAPKAVAPPARITNSSVASQGNRGGTWAVVIGINDYPGSSDDLYSAVNDANDVAAALGNFGVDSEHLLVLRDGQVNSHTLLDSVNWLAANAGPDAVAVFFYAGHVRKTSAGNEEIVTSNGSAVSDSQLASALSRVRANRSWVGIAACYGGGFTEVLRPGRVLTAAAGANSLAYENSDIGRSYMVEYMVRQAMLNNRASATVQTAFNYAVDRISHDRPGREPVEFDHSDGALDLRAPNAAPAQPAPPEPQQPSSQPPADEPPASDRPGQNQNCTGKGLFRLCSNG